MMKITVEQELISQYLIEGRVMQLATSVQDAPWICTVYYVVYQGNIYWLSWPERRHSQEIATNSQVAAAIVVKQDLPVIGLQIEGNAAEVADTGEVKAVMELYTAKYGSGTKFYDAFVRGENHHRMYKLTPRKIALFDEVNFPANDIKVIERL